MVDLRREEWHLGYQGEEEAGAKEVSDQWLPPFVITDDTGTAVGTIEDGDAVVLFNFRADRMVQISKAFEYEEFSVFDRKRFPKAAHPPFPLSSSLMHLLVPVRLGCV